MDHTQGVCDAAYRGGEPSHRDTISMFKFRNLSRSMRLTFGLAALLVCMGPACSKKHNPAPPTLCEYLLSTPKPVEADRLRTYLPDLDEDMKQTISVLADFFDRVAAEDVEDWVLAAGQDERVRQALIRLVDYERLDCSRD